MMDALILVSKTVTVIFLLHAIWIIFWMIYSSYTLRIAHDNPLEQPPTENLPTLAIMLPALREQAIVEETLRAFATSTYTGRLLVIPITSERETHERQTARTGLTAIANRLDELPPGKAWRHELGKAFTPTQISTYLDEIATTPKEQRLVALRRAFDSIPTTADLCQKVAQDLNSIKGLHRVVHIHSEQVDGRKGSQLIDAASALTGILRGVDPRSVYLGIYDFDASPHPDTFMQVGRSVEKAFTKHGRPPAILQQVQLPLRFRSPFASGLDGLLMRGQVLYWLRRALAIEVGRLIQNRWLRSLPRGAQILAAPFRPMIYGIGSGIFVNMSLWHQLGSATEMQETIGHRASLLGYEQILIPSFNLTEPYYHAQALMRGWANVCFGSLSVAREIKHVAPYSSTISSPGKWLLVGKELLDIAIWTGGVLIIPACLYVSLVQGGFWLFLVLATIALAYPTTATIALLLLPRLPGINGPDRASPWLTRLPSRLTLIVTFVAAPFVSATGPWLTAFRLFRVREYSNAVLSTKTER